MTYGWNPNYNFDGIYLRLQDFDADGFGIIFDYFYTTDFATTVPANEPKDLNDYIYACMYADKLKMCECKNSIIDLIQLIVRGPNESGRTLVRKAVTTLQLDESPDRTAPLYRLLVDRLTHDLGQGTSMLATSSQILNDVVHSIFENGGVMITDTMTRYSVVKNMLRSPADPAGSNDRKYHERKNHAAAQACPRASKVAAPVAVVKFPHDHNQSAILDFSSGSIGALSERKTSNPSSTFGNAQSTFTRVSSPW